MALVSRCVTAPVDAEPAVGVPLLLGTVPVAAIPVTGDEPPENCVTAKTAAVDAAEPTAPCVVALLFCGVTAPVGAEPASDVPIILGTVPVAAVLVTGDEPPGSCVAAVPAAVDAAEPTAPCIVTLLLCGVTAPVGAEPASVVPLLLGTVLVAAVPVTGNEPSESCVAAKTAAVDAVEPTAPSVVALLVCCVIAPVDAEPAADVPLLLRNVPVAAVPVTGDEPPWCAQLPRPQRATRRWSTVCRA